VKVDMLKKEVFYTRLASIVPGNSAPGMGLITTDADIYFEPLSMSGLEEMHRYSQDARLYEFFEFDPFDTIEKTRAYIEKINQKMAGDIQNKTAVYWFVRKKIDGYLIGTAGLTSLDYFRQSIEWGYGIDPALWGQGYILQIEQILKHYVFEVLELNRLHGTTMITNERTKASLLTTGMRHEGTLRQYYCKNGTYIDGWSYAMLRQDYMNSIKQASNLTCSYAISDVVDIVQTVLTDEEINIDSSMSNSYSWDSLSHMTIMVAISERMGINLSPNEVARATSIKAIYSMIKKEDLKDN
jgi:ribosomal-protein-alanine N-acetyltransferase